MKYNYLILAIAGFALFSCSREKAEAPETITIRAYQEGATGTRTTLIDGGTQVYWEPSDEIKVFFNGSGGRFLAQNTENVTVATFSGTINVVAGANEGSSSNYMTWGVYPYRSDATSDGESVTTTLPSEQTGRAGSFAKNTHITLAQSGGLNLAFYNVTGGLRFSLTQEGIKRVTFEANNGDAIAGKIKLAFVDGIPAVQEVSEGESTISLTAPGGGSFLTGQWYYISAIPGKLSGGYKMTFFKESESAKLTSSSPVTFKRGIYGSLADADEDLVFKPTGGGDGPNPDDIIQFADPIAKYACVDKFDTNHDGEISYAEAAAVTSLYGLFTNWNTVTSFEEIKFFTAVTSTEGVFSGLSKLTHITIPNWITRIGSFQNCSSLVSVVLPAEIAFLPSYCFDGCSSLMDITLPVHLTSIPSYCFQSCSALKTLELPSGLQAIGQYAFKGCSSLISVTIPDGVSLGTNAFSDCSKLASVVLPDDLNAIPDFCFQNCTTLATIAWPHDLITIGKYAFAGCQFEGADYTVELPSTVTSIGVKAFDIIRHLIIPSTSPVSIAADSFGIDHTFLYVPSNMVEMYKVRSYWINYANHIWPISVYPAGWTVGGTVGEAVDLGLSVKWASWNLGASTPEEYGRYFAWGETDPKWDYDWRSYKWCNGSYNTLTKYSISASWGIEDNKRILDLDDDAAHVHWGGTWRIPTNTDMVELKNNCTWERTSVNGISGWEIKGPNGNCIFLPAAGYREDARLYSAGSEGDYWSSSLVLSLPESAVELELYSSTMRTYSSNRKRGQSIRPVCD